MTAPPMMGFFIVYMSADPMIAPRPAGMLYLMDMMMISGPKYAPVALPAPIMMPVPAEAEVEKLLTRLHFLP